MVTTISTTQAPEVFVAPGNSYTETITWDLDPTTLLPVGTRVTRTPVNWIVPKE